MSTLLTRNTRRGALAAGAIGLLLGSARSSAAACAIHGSDLFVFRAASSGNLVLAVTFLSADALLPRPGHSQFELRIHSGWNVGATTWTVGGTRPPQAGVVSDHGAGRTFVGEVRGRHVHAGKTLHAVVLETPPDLVRTGESLGVWAEICTEDGARVRVGSLFVAAILARDPLLSTIYHAATPAQDSALLAGPLAEHGAIMAATRGGIADPEAQGKRVATFLLPDVITYRPGLPVGFTFANQNGRHPAEDTAVTVETVLTGAVARGKPATPFQLAGMFPYFAAAA